MLFHESVKIVFRKELIQPFIEGMARRTRPSASWNPKLLLLFPPCAHRHTPILRANILGGNCLLTFTPGLVVLLFGFYALLDGVFSLLAAIGGCRHLGERWLLALESIVGVQAEVVTLRLQHLQRWFSFLISIWAMATGFLRIPA
jgi:hypothetical protein